MEQSESATEEKFETEFGKQPDQAIIDAINGAVDARIEKETGEIATLRNQVEELKASLIDETAARKESENRQNKLYYALRRRGIIDSREIFDGELDPISAEEEAQRIAEEKKRQAESSFESPLNSSI